MPPCVTGSTAAIAALVRLNSFSIPPPAVIKACPPEVAHAAMAVT
jgi:hypothetical protein